MGATGGEALDEEEGEAVVLDPEEEEGHLPEARFCSAAQSRVSMSSSSAPCWALAVGWALALEEAGDPLEEAPFADVVLLPSGEGAEGGEDVLGAEETG